MSRADLRREAHQMALRHARRDLRWVLSRPLGGDPLGWAVATLAQAGAAALVLAGMVYLLVLYLDAHVPYWQLWAAVTGLLTTLWIMGTKGPAAQPAPEPEPGGGPAEPPTRAFAQADRWAFRLSATEQRPEQFVPVVRDRVAGVVAARLRQRHGVRLVDEPARARAVLDPELYRFLTEPVVHPPDPAELAHLITRIEEI